MKKKLCFQLRLFFVIVMVGFVTFGGDTGLAQSPQSTGKEVYTANCASCHEGGLKGWLTSAPVTGNQKEWSRFFKNGLDRMTEHTLAGTRGMQPKGGCSVCTEEQIRAAVDYIMAQTR